VNVPKFQESNSGFNCFIRDINSGLEQIGKAVSQSVTFGLEPIMFMLGYQVSLAIIEMNPPLP
jgi:hypothetical protein